MSLLTLLIVTLLLVPSRTLAKCNPYNCTNFDITDQVCYEFNSWSDLNKELNNLSVNCANPPYGIKLQPSAPILLNSELNISLEFNTEVVNVRLTVYGLSGLNVYPWPPVQCGQPTCPKKDLYIGSMSEIHKTIRYI
jgi:hypothetical protein